MATQQAHKIITPWRKERHPQIIVSGRSSLYGIDGTKCMPSQLQIWLMTLGVLLSFVFSFHLVYLLVFQYCAFQVCPNNPTCLWWVHWNAYQAGNLFLPLMFSTEIIDTYHVKNPPLWFSTLLFHGPVSCVLLPVICFSYFTIVSLLCFIGRFIKEVMCNQTILNHLSSLSHWSYQSRIKLNHKGELVCY